jgi:fluoride exporter
MTACPSGPDPERQELGFVVCYERCVQVFVRSTPFSVAVLSAVAAGGAIGAAGRWFVTWVFDSAGAGHLPGTWPWATLAENVAGCLLIGFAARLVERDTVSWAFVVTGVLGGFTTFSAFAVELNDLAEADRMTLAVVYGALTLAAGLGAVLIGTAGRYRP